MYNHLSSIKICSLRKFFLILQVVGTFVSWRFFSLRRASVTRAYPCAIRSGVSVVVLFGFCSGTRWVGWDSSECETTGDRVRSDDCSFRVFAHICPVPLGRDTPLSQLLKIVPNVFIADWKTSARWEISRWKLDSYAIAPGSVHSK